MVKIAIIIASTRQHRRGPAVSDWVDAQAEALSNAEFEVLDLEDFPLGLSDESGLPIMVNRVYDCETTTRWSQAIDSFDGFVFITPEYNHGYPAALKNALDHLYPEWNNKACGFVSYGSNGGVRSVEQLREVVGQLQIADVQAAVALNLASEWTDGVFTPGDYNAAPLNTMLGQLVSWATALRETRVAVEAVQTLKAA